VAGDPLDVVGDATQLAGCDGGVGADPRVDLPLELNHIELWFLRPDTLHRFTARRAAWLNRDPPHRPLPSRNAAEVNRAGFRRDLGVPLFGGDRLVDCMPRGYPPEFRRRVLDLLRAGRMVAELVRDLQINAQTIDNWRRQELIDTG
jgi:hypothetical protein